MAVVQRAVEHGGDGGAVAEQFSPVFHGAVGSEQRASAFVAAHDDFQELFCRCGQCLGIGSRRERPGSVFTTSRM